MSDRIQEDQIRPQRFNEGKLAALKHDLSTLRNQVDKFEYVRCPACNSDQFDFIFAKFGFKFVQCLQCDTVFMNPRGTPEILNDFYKNSKLYQYWEKHIFPASLEVRRKKIFQKRLQRIVDICNTFQIEKRCVLEIGAGYGIFCEEAMKSGLFKHVIAIEPNESLANRCLSAGINVIQKTVENTTKEDFSAQQLPINIAVSFEVIEHLYSPADFLNHCCRIMDKNSVIAVTCPNFKGFDIQMLQEKSDSVDAEHINLFNPFAIEILFNRCRFDVLDISTPGELDAEIVRRKILENEYNIASQPFLKTLLIDRWEDLSDPFQDFLQEHKLSSHMMIVARKKKDT